MGDLGLRLLLQLLGKRKELVPSRLLIANDKGYCCWEQRPLLLLTDKEELAGLAQPDKKEIEISGC